MWTQFFDASISGHLVNLNIEDKFIADKNVETLNYWGSFQDPLEIDESNLQQCVVHVFGITMRRTISYPKIFWRG